MKRDSWLGAGLFLGGVLALGACAGTTPITKADMEKPDASLVCGYLDMSDAPSQLEYFTVKQVLPKSDKPYWIFGVRDGVFCHLALPPGSYQLSEFGGTSGLHLGFITLGGSDYKFIFPAQASGFRVPKPGVHFIGSFKYKKTGTFFNRKFDIERVNAPSESEVFAKVRERVQGTKWEPAVAKLSAE